MLFVAPRPPSADLYARKLKIACRKPGFFRGQKAMGATARGGVPGNDRRSPGFRSRARVKGLGISGDRNQFCRAVAASRRDRFHSRASRFITMLAATMYAGRARQMDARGAMPGKKWRDRVQIQTTSAIAPQSQSSMTPVQRSE
jgi:hypothetical protein